MTEQQTPTPPAKKAPAKKTAARKAPVKKAAAEKRVVFLVGNSRGGKHGDRREVDTVRAAELVAAGLARYPKSKG